MPSVLDVMVSSYSSYRDNRSIPVNLLKWLQSDRYAHKVIAIRSMKEKAKRDKIKATLPAITVSGLFEPTRKEEHLIQHSRLFCIDIDYKGNEWVNFQSLKHDLFQNQHIAYAGLSVSGRGIFLIIPIENPKEQKRHFVALKNDFKKRGISIDTAPQNVASLRGYSFDSNALFRHSPVAYNKIPHPVLVKRKNRFETLNEGFSKPGTQQKVERTIQIIIDNRIDITTHEPDWFRIACALANEFGEQGRAYFHLVSQFHPEYRYGSTDQKFDNALTSQYVRIGIGTFFQIASTVVNQ